MMVTDKVIESRDRAADRAARNTAIRHVDGRRGTGEPERWNGTAARGMMLTSIRIRASGWRRELLEIDHVAAPSENGGRA